MEPGHKPVMPGEILSYFRDIPCSTVIDGTAGGGGHTELLLQAFPHSRILAFERDPETAALLERRFSGTAVEVVNRSYIHIPEVLAERQAGTVDAALFDLGLSSIQLDTPERGFSHRFQGVLDMRFDRNSGKPLHELLPRITEKQLADIIYVHGGEGRSRSIARAIKAAGRITTTEELAEAVRSAVRGNPVKPLARVFQALRIHVNSELTHLEKLLAEMHTWTAEGSRVAVLTFHSTEDRMVKLHFRDSHAFRQFDPPWMVPTKEEKRNNNRSRSARLRLGVRV